MSNCIYLDTDEFCALVYTARTPRARKKHKCCECGDDIQPGDLYENFRGMFPEHDSWSQYKTCARCVNVRTDFFKGWMFESMVDDFMEVHGFDYRDGIPADFTPCAEAVS